MNLLGIYVPKVSYIHKLDGFIKIVCFLLLIIGVINTNKIFEYLIWIIIIGQLSYLSKTSIKELFNGILDLRWFFIIILLMNILFYSSTNPIFTLFIFTPSLTGLIQGINIIFRLMIFIILGNLINISTAPLEVCKGIEILISPLKILKINTDMIAMILSIALQFIPILIEESESIKKAQIARGAKLDSDNLIEKAKSIIPLIVPIFISAFKRADDLANALEARAYDINIKNKNKINLNLDRNDYLSLIVCLLIMFVFIYL